MNKLIAATAGAAAIGLGALTVGSLLPASAVQTQDEEPSTTVEEGAGEYVRPREILADALAELVEAGTLTQEQADAVTAAVQERVDALPDRPRGPGHGHHPGWRILHNALQVAADTIGIDPADLREAVAGGQSVAEVAEANGVTSQAVVDALVAAGNTAVDEAVANGRIDEDRAAEIRDNLPEHAQNFVDHTRPDRGDDTDG